MRRLVFLILAFAILVPSQVWSYDVLVLQSRRTPALEAVLKGFRSGRNYSQRLIIMSDYAEIDVVRIVREERPKLVLALGDAAVMATRKIQYTPVITLLSLAIHNRNGMLPNVTGVGLFASPEQYVELFESMNLRRVGVVYNAVKTGWYVNAARETARRAGIELVTREVTDPREVLAQLATLKDRVDALWMLPDTTAVTRESTEAWFRFGHDQHVPIISFAEAYLGLGAAAVLEIDRFGLGQQAAEMAVAILGGKSITSEYPLYPTSTTLKKNDSVLKRLQR